MLLNSNFNQILLFCFIQMGFIFHVIHTAPTLNGKANKNADSDAQSGNPARAGSNALRQVNDAFDFNRYAVKAKKWYPNDKPSSYAGASEFGQYSVPGFDTNAVTNVLIPINDNSAPFLPDKWYISEIKLLEKFRSDLFLSQQQRSYLPPTGGFEMAKRRRYDEASPQQFIDFNPAGIEPGRLEWNFNRL